MGGGAQDTEFGGLPGRGFGRTCWFSRGTLFLDLLWAPQVPSTSWCDLSHCCDRLLHLFSLIRNDSWSQAVFVLCCWTASAWLGVGWVGG